MPETPFAIALDGLAASGRGAIAQPLTAAFGAVSIAGPGMFVACFPGFVEMKGRLGGGVR